MLNQGLPYNELLAFRDTMVTASNALADAMEQSQSPDAVRMIKVVRGALDKAAEIAIDELDRRALAGVQDIIDKQRRQQQ